MTYEIPPGGCSIEWAHVLAGQRLELRGYAPGATIIDVTPLYSGEDSFILGHHVLIAVPL